MVISEPGTISAARTRKAAELGSPGTLTPRPSSSASPSTVMAREPSRSATVTSRAEVAQHALGVVARGLRLDDGRGARRVQAGNQHGRLDLRRGDRQPVLDRQQVGAAANGERQRVLAALLDLEPHLHQRLEHAAHGPARQRGVARQAHAHVVAGKHAHHQPHAGARVAEVEVAAGLGQAADAAAQHLPGARRPCAPGSPAPAAPWPC